MRSWRTATGILIGIVITARIAFLTNGLDTQRIWDTNTPAAFQFLSAISQGTLGDFFRTDHKYPLAGSLLFAPVVVAYYAVGNITGAYTAPADFMQAYALDETNLFFWIRFIMAVINIGALYLLYRAAGSDRRVGYLAVVLAAADFFVTLFAVQPRIHGFAFAAGTLALYASLRLMEDKRPRAYWAAWGSAACALAVAQSGVTALVLPILAHAYDPTEKRFRLPGWCGSKTRWFLLSGASSLILAVAVGYPQVFLSSIHENGPGLLSQEHTNPSFALLNIGRFFSQSLVAYEPLLVILILCVAAYWVARRSQGPLLAAADRIALAPAIVFF